MFGKGPCSTKLKLKNCTALHFSALYYIKMALFLTNQNSCSNFVMHVSYQNINSFNYDLTSLVFLCIPCIHKGLIKAYIMK